MFSPQMFFANWYTPTSQSNVEEEVDDFWFYAPPQIPFPVRQLVPEHAKDEEWTFLDNFTANTFGEIKLSSRLLR